MKRKGVAAPKNNSTGRATASKKANNASGSASTAPTPIPSQASSVGNLDPVVDLEEEEESEESYLARLKKKERAPIWEHFEKKMVDKRVKGACNYCGKEYFADPTGNGTSSLHSHIDKCRKYPPNMEKMKASGQSVLHWKPKGKELAIGNFNQEEITDACVYYVVVDELSFRHVEGDGFKYFVSRLNPGWVPPSRKTIAKLVFKRYLKEKEDLKKMLSRYRVCLTTDTWTSVQNICYMVITAHFIDDNWVLHKKIINFSAIHNHKGETIAAVLESCLQEWGIDKLLTITVDNASANDVAIRDLIRRVTSWGNPNVIMHGGRNLQMRCVAHILNLIVNDGLSVMNECIKLIRSAVRYVRSSPQRLEKFNMWKEKMKIEGKGGVIMDVPTRWNSTYLMLRSSYKFHKVLDRMFCDDPNAILFFDGATPSLPSMFDWEEAQGFMDFLKPFYDVTLKVCCSYYPSIHDTFGDLLRIKCLLEAQVNPNLIGIREPMIEKYNKYWGDLDKLNQYIFIAIVLDPRYKLEKVLDYLEILFGEMDERVEVNSKMVKDLLYDIYKVYEIEGGFSVGGSQMSNEANVVSSTSMEGLTEFDKKLKEKEERRRARRTEVIHNDVDRYLGDPMENDHENFHLLEWWKINGVHKYPILARIVRDVLAIPVSTIASESCFSTSGRVIDPYRASLSPKMVEALICVQNWIRNDNVAINHELTSEEIEICHEVVEGNI